MKKLYILTIVILLAGCSMLAPKFDGIEYNEFVKINTHAEYLAEECGTGGEFHRLKYMKFGSASLLTYATHIPNNEEIIGMAKIINDDILEMDKRGHDMSVTYCQLKAKQLLIKLDEALDSIGNLN